VCESPTAGRQVFAERPSETSAFKSVVVAAMTLTSIGIRSFRRSLELALQMTATAALQ